MQRACLEYVFTLATLHDESWPFFHRIVSFVLWDASKEKTHLFLTRNENPREACKECWGYMKEGTSNMEKPVAGAGGHAPYTRQWQRFFF